MLCEELADVLWRLVDGRNGRNGGGEVMEGIKADVRGVTRRKMVCESFMDIDMYVCMDIDNSCDEIVIK